MDSPLSSAASSGLPLLHDKSVIQYAMAQTGWSNQQHLTTLSSEDMENVKEHKGEKKLGLGKGVRVSGCNREAIAKSRN